MTHFCGQVCRLAADLGPPTEPRHAGLQKLVHGIRVRGSDVLGGAQPATAQAYAPDATPSSSPPAIIRNLPAPGSILFRT